MVRKGWKNAAIVTAMSLMLLPTFQAYAATAKPNTNGNFVQAEGNWKFQSSDGKTVQGWVVSNNEWYYLDPVTGNLRSGWLKSEDGKTYFLYTVHDGNFGKAVNGWNWIDGYCYYFESADNAENGILKTGGRTQDGYLVDSAGRWVNESTGQPVYEAGKGLPSSDSDQKVAGIDRPISGGSASGTGSSASGAGISAGRGGRTFSGNAGSSNSSGSGASNSANENNNSNNENNNSNNEKNNANNENSSVEKSVLNTEKTKVVHTELGDFVSVVFSEGSLSDYDVYIDGTNVSEALTKVDDEGRILKWISTVASPKKLELKKKGSEELVQTISLNEGTAEGAIDAGNPEDAPKYLLTRGRISKYDYYLSPKDKEGKERIYPSTTTFDLAESRKENSNNVSTSYYVKPLLINAEGKSVSGEPLVAKFSISGEEQKKWFDGIDKLSLLRYEDNTLINRDLSFESTTESSQYGTNGVIKVYSGQNNMRNHGLYLLNIHSSYTKESVTIPVELVKAEKFNLQIQAQSNNAKQGERVGFDVVGENGATFGNDLKVDNMMVTLIKPDGTSHELSYIHDFFNFTNYFILYGTGGADGKTVNTDQVGTYKIKIRYAGYQEMEKEFTIYQGKAVNLEDSEEEKAKRSAARKKNAGTASSGKKSDAVSAATSGSIGKKKKSDKNSTSNADSVSRATGGGSSHIDGRVVFNYDLLSNALLLNELEMLNSDASAVVKTYYSMTIDDSSYLYNEGADAFYSYRDYLNENTDRKAKGEKLLSFKEFTEKAEKKDYHGPSQVLNVLEDGRLGGLTDFKLVKGKKTPNFSGTSTEMGGEFVLKTEDKAYLAAIKGVYVDGQTANLLDRYAKPIVINKEEGTILVKRDAFNFWLTPEILPHTLRISAEGYRDQNVKLEFTEKEDGLQFSVEGKAESEKDVVLFLGTSEDAKKALANVIAVRIKKPNTGELKTVFDARTGGTSQNDYYVIDKENGTITLKAGLFKEAGEYKYEIKVNKRTKSLSGTIDVEGSSNTPSAPNEEPDQENTKEGHPKKASLVAVTDKDKNQTYRTLAFEGLNRDDLNIYLQNISAVTVNGTEYTEASSSIRIRDNQYIAVGNGYGYKNQLRLDKTSLVEGKNTVVIENSDGEQDRFVVELSSDKKENESSGKKDNSSSNAEKKSSGLEVNKIEKVKHYTGTVESYAVLFKGKEEDVKSALSKIETVSLNGKTLEKASSFIGGFGNFPEDKYAIKDYMGAFGREVSLQLPAKALQDGRNKLSVKLSDGTSFTLNLDKEGKIVEEEAPAGKEFAIESINKKKSFLFGSSLEVKFKDMDQDAMLAFEKTVKSVTLNGKTLEKEISSSSKTGKYYFTLITGAYSGVDHLILSPEDAKEQVNTLTIEAEGYKTLTIEFDKDGKIS